MTLTAAQKIKQEYNRRYREKYSQKIAAHMRQYRAARKMSALRDRRRITVPVTDEEREMLRTFAQSLGYSTQQFVRILISFAAVESDALRSYVRESLIAEIEANDAKMSDLLRVELRCAAAWAESYAADAKKQS